MNNMNTKDIFEMGTDIATPLWPCLYAPPECQDINGLVQERHNSSPLALTHQYEVFILIMIRWAFTPTWSAVSWGPFY